MICLLYNVLAACNCRRGGQDVVEYRRSIHGAPPWGLHKLNYKDLLNYVKNSSCINSKIHHYQLGEE